MADDLSNVGRMIGYHFDNFWALRFEPGKIDGAGFKVEQQSHGKFVVRGYPEQFVDEMIRWANKHYAQAVAPTDKTSRQRKPIREFSAKANKTHG